MSAPHSQAVRLTPRVFLRGMAQTSVTVAGAVAIGDVLSQLVTRAPDAPLDGERTARMFASGLLVGAPVSYAWNQFLERALPGRELRTVFLKMAANGLFAPVQISLSFTTIALLAGRSLSDARAKIEHDLPVTFAVGTMYWPLIGFVQFRYVPLAHRPLVGSLAGILYQTFFSNMANRPVSAPSAPAAVAPIASGALPASD